MLVSTRWFLILAATMIVSTLVVCLFLTRVPQVQAVELVKGHLEGRFTAQGLVRAREALVRAPAAGHVTRVAVKNDDPVTLGQTLADLENSTAADRLRNAQADFWTAQSDLMADRDNLQFTRERLSQELSQAREEESRASRELALVQKGVDPARRRLAEARVAEMAAERDRTRLERQKVEGLLAQGVISANEAGQARSQEAQARARWEQARQDLALLAPEQAARLEAARDRLGRARDGVAKARVAAGESVVLEEKLEGSRKVTAIRSQSLEASRASLFRRTITSPMEGRVWRVLVKDGDYVETGTPAFKLLDDRDTWVEAQVAEQEAELVLAGAPVQVRSSAGSVFAGTIRRLDPGLEDPDDVPGTGRYLRLEVALPAHTLRAGARVEVSGTGFLARDVTVVPRAALIQREQGTWVATVVGGRVRLVQVTVGHSTVDGAALQTGPPVGTMVIVESPEAQLEGQRVRVTSTP